MNELKEAIKRIKMAIHFVETTTNPDKQTLINTQLEKALKSLESL